MLAGIDAMLPQAAHHQNARRVVPAIPISATDYQSSHHYSRVISNRRKCVAQEMQGS